MNVFFYGAKLVIVNIAGGLLTALLENLATVNAVLLQAGC
jgi:hypothetical protein